MIDTVYMDQDGVLADFFGGLAKWMGMPYPEVARMIDPDGWIQTHSLTPPFQGTTSEQMMRLIGDAPPSYWEDLEPNLETISLLREIVTAGKVHVAILTRTPPAPNENSIKGKTNWIKQHLGDLMIPVHFVQSKREYAKPSAVLIDDEPKNTTAFIEGGGKAFLWPQVWHEGYDAEQAKAHVLCKEFLLKLGVL